MTRRPWVRGALPWLSSGPLHRVRADTLPAVDAFLVEHDYARVALDGRRMTTRAGLHAELATAFAFPDWYGGTWNAFHDCFYEVESRHRDRCLAVVWTDFDVSARGAPASVAEAVWALLDAEFHRELVLDVFAVSGELAERGDFDGP